MTGNIELDLPTTLLGQMNRVDADYEASMEIAEHKGARSRKHDGFVGGLRKNVFPRTFSTLQMSVQLLA